MKRYFLIMMLVVVLTSLSCGGGGTPIDTPPNNLLTAEQIVGPDSVYEVQSATYTVVASGVTGIAYSWSVNPSSAGYFTNATSATANFTASEVANNSAITIQVLCSASGQTSQTRTKSISVINNEAVQAPHIESVWMSNFSAGALCAFSLTVTGTAPTYYSWNFGGGATPNTSTQSMPEVTLGNPGSYNGSITVSNAQGNDTLDFGYTVEQTGQPGPHIETVWMTSFDAGSSCIFSLTVTGSQPTSYSWNFGGGASPNTSTLATPEAILGATGIYSGTVTVSNAYGNDSLNFGYTLTSTGGNQFAILDGHAELIADDYTYLGLISSNEFLSDSIMNEFGQYGSQFSQTSIFNEFGTYGSQFSSLSAWNDLASRPPLIFIGDVFVAYLTTNTFITPRIDTYELVIYLSN